MNESKENNMRYNPFPLISAITNKKNQKDQNYYIEKMNYKNSSHSFIFIFPFEWSVIINFHQFYFTFPAIIFVTFYFQKKFFSLWRILCNDHFKMIFQSAVLSSNYVNSGYVFYSSCFHFISLSSSSSSSSSSRHADSTVCIYICVCVWGEVDNNI